MFFLRKVVNGRINVPDPEYLPVADNLAVEQGTALVLSGGKLAKCGSTAIPQFISIGCKKANDTDRTLAVIRIEKNHIYETKVTASPASLVVGSKVTISADSMDVTATTASGVVTIVDLNGATASGDKIYVSIT